MVGSDTNRGVLEASTRFRNFKIVNCTQEVISNIFFQSDVFLLLQLYQFMFFFFYYSVIDRHLTAISPDVK